MEVQAGAQQISSSVESNSLPRACSQTQSTRCCVTVSVLETIRACVTTITVSSRVPSLPQGSISCDNGQAIPSPQVTL